MGRAPDLTSGGAVRGSANLFPSLNSRPAKELLISPPAVYPRDAVADATAPSETIDIIIG